MTHLQLHCKEKHENICFTLLPFTNAILLMNDGLMTTINNIYRSKFGTVSL